jgi:tetratricopeptide (TPR) repeat protein
MSSRNRTTDSLATPDRFASRMSRVGRRLLVPLALLAMLPAPQPTAGGNGFARFLEKQTKIAQTAARKKDHAAANAAWLSVLELDGRSIIALDGLAEVARIQEDLDAEVFWRTELNKVLGLAIAAGERIQANPLRKSAERLGKLDPFAGRAEEILAEYGAAQSALAESYLADGLYANALVALQRQRRLLPPKSPGAEAVDALVRDVLRSAPDEVAANFGGGVLMEPRDEEWIADFDKKSAKWSRAAKWETPHYRIKTNSGYRIGSETAVVMEQLNAFYRETWGIVSDPPPKKIPEGVRDLQITPIEVNIYATIEEYRKRAGDGEQDWSAGNFTGSAVNTYDHSQQGGKGSRATLRTLSHEASHQFMSVAVGSVPSFVNEGIASLFEGIEVLSNGNIRRDLPVSGRLIPLAAKLENGTAMPLANVMNARENKPELYDYRWGFMYFLRMYVDGQGRYVYRDRLQDYIYEFKKGSPGDMVEHFTEFFLDEIPVPGMETFAEFEAVWSQWILDLAEELRTADKRLDEYRGKGRLAGLKADHEEALRFYEKALDIDPDDVDAVFGIAIAAAELGFLDRTVAQQRRFLDLAEEDDSRRRESLSTLASLDPHDQEYIAARRELAGGMASLAREYDSAGMPRMAMRCGRAVLDVDPFEPAARALVNRIERETGLTVVRWQRLFNGFDLDGWYSAEGDSSFYVDDGVLVNDSSRVGGGGGGIDPDAITYQALLLERPVDGDWSFEVELKTSKTWQIVGMIFGGQDTDHYEAIVLRKTGSKINNVDFGSYDTGSWTFRGDGSYKAEYNAAEGVTLLVDVRGRQVSVKVNGEVVEPIVGGKRVPSIKYPLAALRGDVGLLASRGTTRFTDVRLLSGAER